MKSRLLSALDRLASLDYQRKWIVAGTSDDFVLPEDLLDEPLSVAHTTLGNPTLNNALSDEDADAVRQFVVDVNRHAQSLDFADPHLSNHDLVESNQHWAAIRNVAQECADRIRRTT